MVFPGLAIDTLHVAVVPLMVIEADGVAACTDVACAVAEQDNNRINARMRESVFFFINHKVIFDYLFKSSYMPV